MIIVCSLSDFPNLCESIKPSHAISVIDPGFAPGVGTPEPFGMTPYEVLQTINFFSDRIVAFDCVEVCPPYDNGNTSALAARIIRHLVGAIWQSQERFK